MERTASAHVTFNGEHLGTVGPFALTVGWWSDVAELTQLLGEQLGVPVMVLRLVGIAGGKGMRDGHVTYHAEALHRPGRTLPPPPDTGQAFAAPAPLRAGWATATGVREALAWAEKALGGAGRPPTGPVHQAKTWNLSGLFRIPTAAGPAWLKATPLWASCEATTIELATRVDPTLMPTVLAADRTRRWTLLDHIPGEDRWQAGADLLRATTVRWTTAQAALAPLITPGTGLIDRRPEVLIGLVHTLLDGEVAGELTPRELAQARELAGRLPALVAELAACGLPDTLVHGDFHPGNWRSDGTPAIVVDFADSALAHPAFDGIRLREFVAPELRPHVSAAWTETWATLVPGSDPARAMTVAEPLAHLAQAVKYQEFLDNIETSERRYHAGDPADAIRDALAS